MLTTTPHRYPWSPSNRRGSATSARLSTCLSAGGEKSRVADSLHCTVLIYSLPNFTVSIYHMLPVCAPSYSQVISHYATMHQFALCSVARLRSILDNAGWSASDFSRSSKFCDVGGVDDTICNNRRIYTVIVQNADLRVKIKSAWIAWSNVYDQTRGIILMLLLRIDVIGTLQTLSRLLVLSGSFGKHLMLELSFSKHIWHSFLVKLSRYLNTAERFSVHSLHDCIRHFYRKFN